ncbi:DCL family protein [Streptomyces sp. H39-S7]|uniref:DCL family protein n=1 Tax=Streptomyces sp. H39-S7 TaxID=3004357 RepID=UPI0022B06005|nr:DCL family protein [Streptomyces sp. H39-S7]MCZ4117901.1 DCL family protein [Streptomyces sp. H39-S7]
MAKPIFIGNVQFPTKVAALEACRAALHRYPLGGEVTESCDKELLIGLVQMHRDPPSKIGAGIQRFEVRPNPDNARNRSFFIIRVDGTETDFSYTKLIQPPTQRQLVERAMRRIVAPQVIEFVGSEFHRQTVVKCPITGAMMDSPTEAHVDHYDPEFAVLAMRFAEAHDGWEAFELLSVDGQIGQRFQDERLCAAWYDYHKQHAKLRVVTKLANLSLLRR